jgi:prevent-host-death family protein
MKTVSAKELKNKTGEVLHRVERGQRVLITRRGKPLAVLSPAAGAELKPAGLRDYKDAWKDIERDLRAKSPRFKTWKEALRETRWRG